MRWLLLIALSTASAHAADLPIIPIPTVLPGASLNQLLPYPARGAPAGRAALLPLIQAEAARQNVPPALADAVAMIETGYDPGAVGSSGEIGLMQVMPGTAAAMGLTGSSARLFDPATNVHYGVAYLARTWAASGGNACRALMKYRAGLGEELYTPLSIQYCRRAATWLGTQDKMLAANVSSHTPFMPDDADPHVIHMASMRGFHFDAAAFAAVADMPVASDGMAAPRPGRHLAESVMAAIRDDAAGDDPHVVPMPAAK